MPQSFENHTQWTPGYHFFTAPLGLIFLGWSIKRVIANPSADTAYMLVGAVALVGAITMLRVSALRVQDRLIRLEERLRMARILPAELQGRIAELRPSHLVALRFASDEELPELTRAVLGNPAMTPKEIKRKVKNWREDYLRA